MIRLTSGDYLGQRTGSRTFGDLRVVSTRYAPGQVLPTHCHEQPYLFVMLTGAFKESALRRDHVCSRGWIVYNAAAEPHRDCVLDSGAEGLNVELPESWSAQPTSRRSHEDVLYRHAGSALPAVGVLQLAMRSPDPLAPIAAEEAVASILDSCFDPARARGAGPAWLRAVESLIHERRGALPGLRGLAQLAGVHPSHLCREFRRAKGRTLSDYAACVRADLALHRVLTTDAPLADVSLECGFADQAHMTRAFRRRFGTTPGRVRRERR